MKNTKVFVFIAVVLALALFLAWDIQNEKKVEEEKKQTALLFNLKPDQVNEFSIESKGSKIKLKRTVDGWQLVEPLADAADDSFVDDFVSRAIKDSYVDVAKEGSDIDWHVYGLENPMGTFVFSAQSGESKKLRLSARQNFEQNSIARLDEENRVLIVPSAWSSHVQRTVLDFRDKRFLRAKISSVDRIEVDNKKGRFVIEQKDGKWISPENPKWILEQNKVREILTQISELKVKDFIEKSESIAVVNDDIKSASKIELKLRLSDKVAASKIYKTKKGNEYAISEDGKKIIEIDRGKSDQISRWTIYALREMKSLFDFKPELISRVEIQNPLKKMTFAIVDKKWKLEGNDSAEITIDQDKLKNLGPAVKSLSALQFAPMQYQKQFKGLNKITFYSGDGKLIYQLNFDNAFSASDLGETKVLLAKSNTSEVFVIDAASINALDFHQLIKIQSSPISAPSQNQSTDETKTPVPNGESNPVKDVQ